MSYNLRSSQKQCSDDSDSYSMDSMVSNGTDEDSNNSIDSGKIVEEKNDTMNDADDAAMINKKDDSVNDAASNSVNDAAMINKIDDSVNDKLCEAIVDRFAERLRIEFGAIVDSLKCDLREELGKHDQLISDLRAEQIMLRDTVASDQAKISQLECQVAELALEVAMLQAAPPHSSPTPPATSTPLYTYETVVAGDSIVKHLDVGSLPGENNHLICLPGARAHKVHHAVAKLAKSASFKNLIFHAGTNSIPYKSTMDVCHELENTLKRLQLDLPDTALHFSALLPKMDYRFNRNINFVNSYICDVCDDLGINFIQHSSFSRNNILNKALFSPSEWKEGRPVHPSHEGVDLMLLNMKLQLI